MSILPKAMIERCKDTKNIIRNNALDLRALDYLKTTSSNFKILLYDELFYWYLALSLKEFIISISGSFCEENNLLFNPGSYKKYSHLAYKNTTVSVKNPQTKQFEQKEGVAFTNIIYLDKKDEIYQRELFFGNNLGLMRVNNDNFGLNFSTPNQKLSELSQYELNYMSQEEKESLEKIFASPLGKYYFELKDKEDIYIEFFKRIYPQKPPMGWDKEMMAKLNLSLE